MKKVNKKNKKYFYILIILLAIVLSYLFISNLEVVGKASETVLNKLVESSSNFKESRTSSNLESSLESETRVATPTVVLSSIFVTLDITTPGAIVRYTVDGSEPTENSTIYSEPLSFKRTTTLKAKAFKPNWQPSLTTKYNYVVAAETPTASLSSGLVDYLSSVILSTTTPGATIRYTLNSDIPTESSMIYSSPIILSESTIIMARAFKENCDPSEIVGFNYIINTVANPTASHSSGDVSYGESVSLNTTTNGAVIKYTLDNSEPTENSAIYSNPFTITSTTSIKAKSFKAGHKPSSTITFNFMPPTVSIPVTSPTYSNVNYGANVVLETLTPGAFIRYTLNGSEPNEESDIYNNTPFIINNSPTIIKAKAYKLNHQPSSTATFNFTINTVANPTSSPSHGAVSYGESVSLTTVTTGATIRYTIDGSEPTENSAVYSTPLTITNSPTIIKAKAFKAGHLPSSTVTFNFSINTVANPISSPSHGIVSYGESVSLTTVTTGATIRYTIDGSEPTENSAVYSTPLTITNSPTIIKAKAFKTGHLPSSIVTFYFTFQTVAMPTATPSGGTIIPVQHISLAVTTSGATIRYTLDGSEPTTSSTEYLSPFTISQSKTLKAKAFKTGWLESNTRIINYNIPSSFTYLITGNTVTYLRDNGIRTWGCEEISIDAHSNNGSENTDDIIAECGTNNAAFTCRNLNYLGFSDWYLPSVSELISIGDAISSDEYWTSESALGYNGNYRAKVVTVPFGFDSPGEYHECSQPPYYYNGCPRTSSFSVMCIRKAQIN